MVHPRTRAVLFGRNRTHSRAVVAAGFALGIVWAVVTPLASSGAQSIGPTSLVAVAFVVLLPIIGSYWNDGLFPACGCIFGVIFTYFLVEIITAPPPSGDVVVLPGFFLVLLTAAASVFAAGFGTVGFLLGAGTRRALRRGRAWFDDTDQLGSTLATSTRVLLVGRRYDRAAIFLGVGLLLGPVAGVIHGSFPRGIFLSLDGWVSLLLALLLTAVLVFGLPLAGAYWNDGLLICWVVEFVLVLSSFLFQRYPVSEPIPLSLGAATVFAVSAFLVGAGGRRLVGRSRAWTAESAAGEVPVGFEALVFGTDPHRSVVAVALGIGLVAATLVDIESGIRFLYSTTPGGWVRLSFVVLAAVIAFSGVGLVPTVVLVFGLVFSYWVASGYSFSLIPAPGLLGVLLYATALGSFGFLLGILIRQRFRSENRNIFS